VAKNLMVYRYIKLSSQRTNFIESICQH